jgi:hypothetical protein
MSGHHQHHLRQPNWHQRLSQLWLALLRANLVLPLLNLGLISTALGPVLLRLLYLGCLWNFLSDWHLGMDPSPLGILGWPGVHIIENDTNGQHSTPAPCSIHGGHGVGATRQCWCWTKKRGGRSILGSGKLSHGEAECAIWRRSSELAVE